MQEESKCRHLEAQGKTRWGTIINTFTTCKQSSALIWNLTGEVDFLQCEATQLASRTTIKALFRTESMPMLFNQGVAILAPINAFITKVQNDNLPLSSIFVGFKTLLQQFQQLETIGILTNIEALYIIELIKKYESFTINKAHKFAYLLDPRYIGDLFSQVEFDEIEELLCMQPVTNVATLPDSDRFAQINIELGYYVIILFIYPCLLLLSIDT